MSPRQEFYFGEENLNDKAWTQADMGEGNYACEITSGGVRLRGYLSIRERVLGFGTAYLPVVAENKYRKLADFNNGVMPNDETAYMKWAGLSGSERIVRKGKIEVGSVGGACGTWSFTCMRTDQMDGWRINERSRAPIGRSPAGLAQVLTDTLGWEVKPLDKKEAV